VYTFASEAVYKIFINRHAPPDPQTHYTTYVKRSPLYVLMMNANIHNATNNGRLHTCVFTRVSVPVTMLDNFQRSLGENT